ncbi:MAG TPA: glutathione transferase GstA [Acidiferrobacteraceae bacterium]|nr:glutathione transferase GstA [Acidiferrobacteraceae bacterium]
MQLYFAPGACSLAPHIALNEGGFQYTAVQVDLKTHTVTSDGTDFLRINPKGYVPVLVLDNGQTLTEVAVLLQYLAAQKAGLAPAAGTPDFYRCLEWVSFIATELHKSFGPLFSPTASDAMKARQIELIGRRFGYVSQHLKSHAWLLGADFSIADIYLFTIANWSQFVHLDLAPWPELQRFMERMRQRPQVAATLKAEGLA